MRCSGHLLHEIRRVDRLALRLRVEYMGIQRLAQVGVVGLEEAVEVGVGRVGEVECVGREAVGALGAKLRRVVLRDGLRGVQEAVVGEGERLGKGLALGGGEEGGAVQPRAGDGVRRRVLGGVEAQGGAVLVLEMGLGAGRGRVAFMRMVAG